MGGVTSTNSKTTQSLPPRLAASNLYPEEFLRDPTRASRMQLELMVAISTAERIGNRSARDAFARFLRATVSGRQDLEPVEGRRCPQMRQAEAHHSELPNLSFPEGLKAKQPLFKTCRK